MSQSSATVPANATTPAVQAVPQVDPNAGTTSTTVSALGPNDIIVTLQYINDNSWPKDFKLDIELGNWDEWSLEVTFLADRQGFAEYLDGTLSQPDATTHPKANQLWAKNDRSLRGFLFSHVSRSDYRAIRHLPTSHLIFEELCSVHEKLGIHMQLVLLTKAMTIRYQPDVPYSKTTEEIDKLFSRIEAMGPIDNNRIRATLMLNALQNLDSIHSHLLNLADDPSFSYKTIARRLTQEESIKRSRTEQLAQSSTALAAQGRGKPRTICTNCQRPGHLVDFCVRAGGKMAGRSIDDARAAAANLRANAAKTNESKSTPSPSPASAHVATTGTAQTSVTDNHSATTPNSIVIGGLTYSLNTAKVPPATANIAVVDQITSDSDDSLYSYHSYIALSGPTVASVDWTQYSQPPNPEAVDVTPVTSNPGLALVTHEADKPFILDSGASTHISPERSDFKNLRPIAPYSIQGFNGSSTQAVGIGDIDLRIALGHKLCLTDVLFVPSCNTRLVSVSCLLRSGYNFVTFSTDECWISDKFNKIIVRGTLSPTQGLYHLNCASARVTHATAISRIPTPTILYAKRVPDLETWHRRLGHCSNRKIIDMARDKIVKGMPIDLSSSPPKCDHCILGKQTRSSVPKVREGIRATRPLERVYVDLCGPMPAVSRSGRLYSMNAIDDFTGYVWSLPLRLKSKASDVLRAWHRAVENQSGHKLKILVTDNGELVSNSMKDWCTSLGIDHQLTAPYTSAHNGRAERLHRTLLGRARSMRLACNAPASLWDEFCATSAYLTNLTASSANGGKTSHELWFGQTPSLSHLREIGCRAFSLIQTNNPKIYRRSNPCILIGYAPHSKAYRLWDTTSNSVYNSFHVTFIEHLDAQPVDLLPGMTLLHDPDAPPSWEVPSPDQILIPS